MSILHIFPIKINHYNEDIETVTKQIYVYSGYQFGDKLGYSLTPAILYRNYPKSVDVSTKFSFKDKINLVLAWQSTESAYVFFYFCYEKYIFGYSFEYYMSEVQNYNDGTHLISLGYKFN